MRVLATAALALVASLLAMTQVAAQCGVVTFANNTNVDLTAYSGATPAGGVMLTQGPAPYQGTYKWQLSPCVKICNGNGYLAQESTQGAPTLCGVVLNLDAVPAADATGRFIVGQYSGTDPSSGNKWNAAVQMFCSAVAAPMQYSTSYTVTVQTSPSVVVNAIFGVWSQNFCTPGAPGPTPSPGSGPTPVPGSGPTPVPGSGPTPVPGSGPGPAPGPTPAPDAGNNNEGCCTWGAVFLMCFFIPLGVYFFGFLAWNYKNGLRGTEMLPHLQFWASLPGLFADGIRFTWCKIRSQPFEPSASSGVTGAGAENTTAAGSYTTV